MDLNSIMTDMLKGDALSTISKKAGIDSSSSKDMIGKALPLLLGALKKNSSDPSKASSLEKAVEGNSGDILGDLNKIDLKDGSKILGHIFGDKKEEIEKKVGDKNILSALAPMVMGALGKANSTSGVSAKSLLSSESISKMAGSFLDKDGDGDIKDDLLGMVMGFFKKK